MLRSLHMKLVCVLLLLIVALMSVVGSFLISSVIHFYMNEFSEQMSGAFANTDFTGDLRQAAKENDAPLRMARVAEAYAALLGVDGNQRKYAILDGKTGAYLAGSMNPVSDTPNIITAIGGEAGYSQNQTESYFDCAVPVGGYIVYIKDTKQSLQRLTANLFTIIIEAVLFGLLISVLLSLLLSKTMTTPIEKLTQSASRVAVGDFSSPLEVHSSDEIGVLTRTFNSMAEMLRATLETVGSERDKLSTLFLYMTDGVAAFDRKGAMLHVNPAARRYLGLKKDEYQDFDAIFHDILPLGELKDVKTPDFLERTTLRNGMHLQLFFAPFGSEKGEGGLMTVIHDVTEQMRLDEVRREFVSNVSHELRTPLTNVKSYAETLADNEELPYETVKSFAGVIVNETDRMTRLVRDLLTLSRFDYGKMDWSAGLFSIEDAVRSIYDVMLMEALRHNHSCSLEIIGQLPKIWGDKERIEQVLINILSNAFSYTPNGGVIEVTASAEGGESVRISVRDNGIGIPKEDLPRLFERFYRVDKARSRSQGGTGLGLAIALEIVSNHNGTIEVDSEPGKGTSITIVLPVSQGGAEA